LVIPRTILPPARRASNIKLAAHARRSTMKDGSMRPPSLKFPEAVSPRRHRLRGNP
jgi:hypothetical protein